MPRLRSDNDASSTSGRNVHLAVVKQKAARGMASSGWLISDLLGLGRAQVGLVLLRSGGSSINLTASFTAPHDLGSNLWQFQSQGEHHSSQGRWMSPDPAGLAAVHAMNCVSITGVENGDNSRSARLTRRDNSP